MDFTQVGIIAGLVIQIAVIGIAWGNITARLKAVEEKISGNGTYLPRTEAQLLFKASDASRDTLVKELGEVRDDLDRLKDFYAEYSANRRGSSS